MLTLAQAREKFIQSVVSQPEVEELSLIAALGRVAAEDQYSTIAVPPIDNSAMDGFAVESANLSAKPIQLKISQRIPAGQPAAPLLPGTAARIFTGGVMPEGADAVVIQEHCRFGEDDELVTILKPVSAGDNVRPLGQDIAVGEKVVSAGTRLNAVHLGLLASIGIPSLRVYSQITIAVFSTGNELVEPGQSLCAGQIYNSNRSMLLALCAQLGYQTVDCGIVEDTLPATISALKVAASNADIIVTSGGVSVGEEDHVRPAIESLGSVQHWKVQIKPGKPVMLGRIMDKPILGLPGNPVSSYVVFQLLGIPLLRTLQGERFRDPANFKVVANFNIKASSRETYIRVQLISPGDGSSQVELFNNQSSGVLSSLAWADGLVRQHIGQTIEKGDVVQFLPFREGLL